MPKRRANGEGNIRKRKDGRWEGRYTAGYDPESGKRIIKNVLGKTQAEVKEKLKAAISESQRLDVSKAGTYTVSSWMKTWYEVYAEPRIRPNTKSYYTNYIENHIIPGIGSIPLDKLTTTISRKADGFSAKIFLNSRTKASAPEWFAAFTHCCTTAWNRRWPNG